MPPSQPRNALECPNGESEGGHTGRRHGGSGTAGFSPRSVSDEDRNRFGRGGRKHSLERLSPRGGPAKPRDRPGAVRREHETPARHARRAAHGAGEETEPSADTGAVNTSDSSAVSPERRMARKRSKASGNANCSPTNACRN